MCDELKGNWRNYGKREDYWKWIWKILFGTFDEKKKGVYIVQAGFAIWEPAHGCFSFQHPWNQYVKIGASMRDCAYGIEALSSCLISENQVTLQSCVCDKILNFLSPKQFDALVF